MVIFICNILRSALGAFVQKNPLAKNCLTLYLANKAFIALPVNSVPVINDNLLQKFVKIKKLLSQTSVTVENFRLLIDVFENIL